MKVEVRTYEPVPAGIYRLYTKEANLRTSPNGDFISWTCEILDDENYTGKTVSFAMSQSFTPNSKGYQFLQALGLSEDVGRGFELDTDDYLNLTFYARLSLQKNTKGDMVNKFDSMWSEEEQERQMTKLSKKPAPVNAKPQLINAMAKPQPVTNVRPASVSGVRVPSRQINPPSKIVNEGEAIGADEDDVDFPE